MPLEINSQHFWDLAALDQVKRYCASLREALRRCATLRANKYLEFVRPRWPPDRVYLYLSRASMRCSAYAIAFAMPLGAIDLGKAEIVTSPRRMAKALLVVADDRFLGLSRVRLNNRRGEQT